MSDHQPNHDHTCYTDGAPPTCLACEAEDAATPAGIVQRAVAVLVEADEGSAADLTSDLLQILGDEMFDAKAVEVEFPNHIPQYRWQVCMPPSTLDGSRGPEDVDRWTAAVALARAILDLPNPNAVSEDNA